MTQGGIRVPVMKGEDDTEGLFQIVRPLDGILQGMIVRASDRILHPVQDMIPPLLPHRSYHPISGQGKSSLTSS